VAERCGFTYEGCLRRDALTPAKEARDTRVYAKVRGIEWRKAP
jgi:RimJ/RimL family protein N-acetyltransferase